MKKRILSLLFTFFLLTSLNAQDEFIQKIEPVRSYDGVIEYQKSKQYAKMFDFNYPSRDLEVAIEKYLEKNGSKVRSNKGMSYSKKVKLSDAEDKYYDVYYKVSGKGKGDNATSTLSLILAEPDENILLRSAAGEPATGISAPVLFTGASALGFFNGLGSVVGNYQHEKQVMEYEEEFKKAEKKYNNLVEDGKDLEKRKQRIEKEIADNIQNQEKQAKEVEKAKALLEQIRAKKSGS